MGRGQKVYYFQEFSFYSNGSDELHEGENEKPVRMECTRSTPENEQGRRREEGRASSESVERDACQSLHGHVRREAPRGEEHVAARAETGPREGAWLTAPITVGGSGASGVPSLSRTARHRILLSPLFLVLLGGERERTTTPVLWWARPTPGRAAAPLLSPCPLGTSPPNSHD